MSGSKSSPQRFSEHGVPFFSTYLTAWTLHRIYETLGAGNQSLGWQLTEQIAIISFAAGALALQSLRLWLLTIVAVLVADLHMMPFIWDSEYWCIITDMALIASVLAVFSWTELLGGQPLSKGKVESSLEMARGTIVTQMSLFYSAAFFWKLTWDFLRPHSSCAPIFFMQLLDSVLPASFEVPVPLLQVVTMLSPFAVLFHEGFVAFHMWNPALHHRGVLGAIVLHVAIAACPPPENVATFSLMCASRLVCFIPSGSLATASPFSWSAMEVAVTVAVAAGAAHAANHEAFYDLALPLFALVAPFLLKSVVLDSGRSVVYQTENQNQKGGSPLYYRFPVGLAFFYAFLMIPLGLMDQGQPHMYANLRLHGGSNHITGIPTSLLQQWFEKSPSSAFHGGIIRIESSTSNLLNEIYPSEYSLQMSDRSRQMMQHGGHSSRNFNPMLTVCTSSEAPWDPQTSPFVKYTIPAHEFRRILHWLRQNEERKYEIVYTQLEGRGNEEWRATAKGRTVRLAEGPGSTLKCTVRGEGSCTPDDIPNLSVLPLWARKLMLFEPYPIIPGDYQLHCFGP